MIFTFLEEGIESLLLFATAPIYITILTVLQSKNLTTLNKLKNRKIEKSEKIKLLKRHQRLKYLTPIIMLIGLFMHIIVYLIFSDDVFRYGYFLSIAIMYTIYTLIAIINFWIKGAGILKDIGDFNGLPGN